MSNIDLLAEAKRRLPLPLLMAQLGHGDRAKKSARCPFPAHQDSSASFSVFPGSDGEPRWKCFAGCGEPSQGDAIDFLARARNLSNADACREFKRLAGIAETLAPASRRIAIPALHVGTDAELAALSTLRQINDAGLRLASARGLLRFGRWRDRAAWFMTDETGLNAQVRRLDGQLWPQGCKALTLPGARAAWPLGAGQAASFPVVLFCEGGPDLLAAYHFIAVEQRADDAAAVAMLGASLSVPTDALPHFAGRRVRFFTHSDAAGRASVTRWARQLAQAGARVDALALDGLRRADGSPAKDLNDLTQVHPDDFEAHPALQCLVPKD
jgi:hypothetical protein